MNTIKAKKSLGQNFLSDTNILKKIVDFASIQTKDIIIEIGPGKGSLTELILPKSNKLIAIEKDDQLVKSLEEKFIEEIKNGKLEILLGDILEHKPKKSKYKLIGNIPYNITGEIFRKFLEDEHQPESITFVIQKEVANRIMARDEKESILSISIKAYGEPRYGGIVRAGSFNPVPKVDSAIIKIENINRQRFEKFGIKEKDFFNLLKLGFAHKRKKLVSNLSLKIPKIKLAKIFKDLDIEEGTRAENLSVKNWFDLVAKILKQVTLN